MRKHEFRGFTLIELLIVVAIIAILAAIAVPNFLEAQVRAKVSRGKSDMRSMATAMESYRIDTNWYPPDVQFYQDQGVPDADIPLPPLILLTSPIAYITSIPRNVFGIKSNAGIYEGSPFDYIYKSERDWRGWITGEPWGLPPNDVLLDESGQPDYDTSRMWVITSFGPDLTSNSGEYMMFGERVLNRVQRWEWGGVLLADWGCLYDPTNGTASKGDLARVGP